MLTTDKINLSSPLLIHIRKVRDQFCYTSTALTGIATVRNRLQPFLHVLPSFICCCII